MEHLLFWSKCSIFHNIFKSICSFAPFSIILSKVFKTKPKFFLNFFNVVSKFKMSWSKNNLWSKGLKAVWVDALCPSQQLFSYVETFFWAEPVFSSKDKVACSWTRYSASFETWTSDHTISSWAIYHWAIKPLKCHLLFAADDNFKFCCFFKNNK